MVRVVGFAPVTVKFTVTPETGPPGVVTVATKLAGAPSAYGPGADGTRLRVRVCDYVSGADAVMLGSLWPVAVKVTV